MKVTVCIGSSCHLKGSRQVIEQLSGLVGRYGLSGIVELTGAFCMENCQRGVCVKIGDELFSLRPENTEEFFKNNILKKCQTR